MARKQTPAPTFAPLTIEIANAVKDAATARGIDFAVEEINRGQLFIMNIIIKCSIYYIRHWDNVEVFLFKNRWIIRRRICSNHIVFHKIKLNTRSLYCQLHINF